MKRSLVVAGRCPVEHVRQIARAADDSGLHRLWFTETTSRSALIRALVAGEATRRVGVATGIAYTFVRSPLATAIAAADIQDALGGRFALGLGAGTRGLRRRFGVEEDHPAPRFGEYADLVRAALTSEPGPFAFHGRFFQADTPWLRLDTPAALRTDLTIYGSGVNPIMLRTAARHCDAIALHPVAAISPYFEDVVLPAIAEGARRGGRTPLIACWRMCSVHDDETVARYRAKRLLAFYFSTPSYGGALALTRWDAVGAAIRDGFKAGRDWPTLAALVPEDMVDEICLAGTPGQVTEQLATAGKRLESLGVDEIVLEPSGTDSADDDGEAFRDGCLDIIRVAG